MLVFKKSISECAKNQFCDNTSDIKEKLVYSANSLKKFVTLNEKMQLLDAEIKTYPSKFLIKQFSKLFSNEFDYNVCYFSTKLSSDSKKELTQWDADLFKYVKKQNKLFSFGITDRMNEDNRCMIKTHCDNIENDIAGTITFIVDPKDYGNKNVKDKLNQSNTLEKFIQLGDSLGYDFIAYDIESQKYGYMIYFKFEAKFQDTEIKINDYLYHVAPKNLTEKILKYGLIPKSNSSISGKKIRHKDRVYLFNGYKKDAINAFIEQSGKLSTSYSQFFKLLSSTKEYALFKIDKTKINDLKLYRDNMFQSKTAKNPTALFTYSNIKPDAIEFVKYLKIN